MYYIGIDLGTSAVKLLLVDEDGGILNTVTREYPLEFPQPGWSQQNPEDWREAVWEGVPELLGGFDASRCQSRVSTEIAQITPNIGLIMKMLCSFP